MSPYFQNNSTKVSKYFQKLPKVEESTEKRPFKFITILEKIMCCNFYFFYFLCTSLVNESMRKMLLLDIVVGRFKWKRRIATVTWRCVGTVFVSCWGCVLSELSFCATRALPLTDLLFSWI